MKHDDDDDNDDNKALLIALFVWPFLYVFFVLIMSL
jgi:hypothetical protein